MDTWGENILGEDAASTNTQKWEGTAHEVHAGWRAWFCRALPGKDPHS